MCVLAFITLSLLMVEWCAGIYVGGKRGGKAPRRGEGRGGPEEGFLLSPGVPKQAHNSCHNFAFP